MMDCAKVFTSSLAEDLCYINDHIFLLSGKGNRIPWCGGQDLSRVIGWDYFPVPTPRTTSVFNTC